MADDTAVSNDELEDKVLTWLATQSAERLEEVYTFIELEIPADANGKRKTLLNNLLKHLCDLEASDDAGVSTILKMYDLVLKYVQPVIKDETASLAALAALSTDKIEIHEKSISERTFDVLHLKEFKLAGTIGGVGEKDKLSYTSLSYQIANARKQGFSEQKICASVIKAIAAGNNLRTYLESKHDLNLSTLVEVLRSHYKEKDSASVFTELSNAAQQAVESSLDFVIRMMCLRQKILDLSKEEGFPYDENLLKKRFFHAIFTGMRNSNIRVDLREKCKNNFEIRDEELLKYVSEAVANETEINEKLNGNNKKTAVNLVETETKVNNDFKE